MNSASLAGRSTPKRAARVIRAVTRIVVTGLGVAAATYAGSAAVTWYRYGSPQPGTPEEADPLLDRFMAAYEVVERHNVRVRAPAKITLAAAYEQNLLASPVIRAIFKARELALGSTPDERARPQALLPQMLALGWGILAEVPGHEIVMGAVTQPWDPNPRFRALGPEHFAAFDEPDYVKIVWSLRADAVGAHESIFRTETRAVATDDARPADVSALLGPRLPRRGPHPAVVARSVEGRCRETRAHESEVTEVGGEAVGGDGDNGFQKTEQRRQRRTEGPRTGPSGLRFARCARVKDREIQAALVR